LRSNARQIRHACDGEIGTPSAAIRAASASIVQRVAPSGGSSVTVLTSSNTSSWPYVGGRPGRSPSNNPASRSTSKRCRQIPTWLKCIPTSSPILRFDTPSAANKMIRARCAARASIVFERTRRSNSLRSSTVISKGHNLITPSNHIPVICAWTH